LRFWGIIAFSLQESFSVCRLRIFCLSDYHIRHTVAPPIRGVRMGLTIVYDSAQAVFLHFPSPFISVFTSFLTGHWAWSLSLMIDVFVVATVYLWFLYPHVPRNGR